MTVFSSQLSFHFLTGNFKREMKRNIFGILLIIFLTQNVSNFDFLKLIDYRDEMSNATVDAIKICANQKITTNLIFNHANQNFLSFMDKLNEISKEVTRDLKISLKITKLHDENNLRQAAKCNVLIMSSTHNFKALYNESLISHLANGSPLLIVVLLKSKHENRNMNGALWVKMSRWKFEKKRKISRLEN